MKAFRIYFEFYGKQMVTEVEARNENEAKKVVMERINFVKVKEVAMEPGFRQAQPQETHVRASIPSVLDFIMGFKNRKNNV